MHIGKHDWCLTIALLDNRLTYTDMGSAGGGSPPTKVEDSVQAIRHYIAEKTAKDTGSFFDAMTGRIIPF